MSNLNSLLESSNQWKSVQSDAARLASKWDKTGLLEGLSSETDKNNMSLILENQAKQLVVESSQTGGGTSSVGTFTAGTGEQWAGIALPLVRKVFGQIAAKEFVSVQPMSLPSGLVFFLDFQYGGAGANNANDTKFAEGGNVFGSGSLYGVTDGSTDVAVGDLPSKGLYGAGKWTYGSNVTSSVVAAANVTSASATWQEVGYDSALSQSITEGKIAKVTFTKANLNSFADEDGARGFFVSAMGGGLSTTASFNSPAAYNTFDGTNFTLFAKVNKNVEGAAANTVGDATVVYTSQPTDQFRGDFEDGNTSVQGQNAIIDIPEINIKMKSEAIVAKTKKLKAVWTPEFAQDLNAYHSLDAEAELTSIMSEYIALEIDLEIMGMLIENALTTEYWSAVNNVAYDGTTATPSNSNLNFYNTQGQWFQTLGTKINKVSNKIHQLTLRGGANFMVCSPTIGTILESIPGFAAADGADANTMNYAFGIQKVGNLNSKYEVYKNPYMTENTILLGFRGSQFLETGATFAPYIPLIMTPLVYDPTTFTPRKGLLTRYAKKMLRPEYYAKIYVNGLNTL
jgi:hypothetical protein